MTTFRLARLALLLAAAPCTAQNLAGNGSFETPPGPVNGFATYAAGAALGAWTAARGGVDVSGPGTWRVEKGSQAVDLHAQAPGSVVQLVATTAGTAYELSFAYAGNPDCGGGTRTFQVLWNGAVHAQLAFDATGRDGQNLGWTYAPVVDVVAGGPSSTIELRGLAPATGCGALVDDVQLVRDLFVSRPIELATPAAGGASTANSGSGIGPAALSADGRHLAFESRASDLGAPVTAESDVYVRDLATGTTTLVSRAAGSGAGANNESYAPAISADGRYVVFSSRATNLATQGPNPADATPNLWRHDRMTGATRLVTIDAAGTGGGNYASYAAHVDASGRHVAFATEATNLVASGGSGVVLRDVDAGRSWHLTAPAGAARAPARPDRAAHAIYDMTPDGRYVVFGSVAADLVAGTDGNGTYDVFVFDRLALATRLVSHAAGAATTAANATSRDARIDDAGTRIVFESIASDLVPGDGNAASDVFVYTIADGSVALASCKVGCSASGNAESRDAELAGNGRYVAFASLAGDLVTGDGDGVQDLFVRDLDAGATRRLDGAGSGSGVESGIAALDAAGRYVVFATAKDGIAADDGSAGSADLFAYDRAQDRTLLLTRGPYGSADAQTYRAAISADGRRLAFASDARNLTATPDPNTVQDVFVLGLDALEQLFSAGFE